MIATLSVDFSKWFICWWKSLSLLVAAVYLIQCPHTEIFEFVPESLPTSDDGMILLKILAGLSYEGGWNDKIHSTLHQVMNSLLTILLLVNEPVILSAEFSTFWVAWLRARTRNCIRCCYRKSSQPRQWCSMTKTWNFGVTSLLRSLNPVFPAAMNTGRYSVMVVVATRKLLSC